MRVNWTAAPNAERAIVPDRRKVWVGWVAAFLGTPQYRIVGAAAFKDTQLGVELQAGLICTKV